jgi:isoquinoline 1-oxidoreductase beta subunit
MAAAAIGIDSENITIHTTIMGGAFGRRGEIDVPVYAAKIAAAMPGVPVKMTWTREEDMRHDFYRPATIARYRGAVQDGKAVMVDGKIAGISCAHQAMARMTGIAMGGPDTAMLEGAADQPYAIPNYRIRGYLSDMAVPVGFWRSVGASHNGFQFDCFLDEMAHAAGTDPLTFRLEMAREEHAPSASVIEAVRDLSGWTGQTPRGVGRGVAFCMSFGTPVAQVIEVRDEDGLIRISNAWIACDPGIALDPRNIEAQMSGGLIYGLSAAIMGEITFDGGEVDQWNFPDYDAVRMHNVPQIAVQIVEGGGRIAGVGEPGTPPAAAALANALFDLTGKRVRELPLNKHFDFV